MHLVASVCPLPLSRLNSLTYDLEMWYVGRPWPWLAWDCMSRSRSNAKNHVLHHCHIALRSRSKVEVKVMGQGRIFGTQRSILGARLCQVQQRATTITSLRSKVCVSVISQHMQIIAQMQSISFYFFYMMENSNVSIEFSHEDTELLNRIFY